MLISASGEADTIVLQKPPDNGYEQVRGISFLPSRRYAQELCIRYGSGRRYQTFVSQITTNTLS